MEVLLIVFLVIRLDWCDGGSSPLHHSTPENIVLGTLSGQIWRCLLHAPTNCELFYNGTDAVLETLVHGESLFFSNEKGEILKCDWYEKQCAVVHRGYAVDHLAAAGEFLYAADTSFIFRCSLNVEHSCLEVRKIDEWIGGMYYMDKYIYVSTNLGLIRCSNDMVHCLYVARITDKLVRTITDTMVRSISGWGDNIITLLTQGTFVIYEATSSKMRELLKITQDMYKMAIYKGIMYATCDWKKNIMTCKWDEAFNCTVLIQEDVLHSLIKARYSLSCISLVYATHHKKIYLDNDSCGQGSLSTVFSYREEHRGTMAVSVADGKLVDVRGAPVDTRRADVGYSGPAAVFAMGPSGQILVSNAHRSGLVHITSFFAGNPVAGAGEMVVVDGVIKRIVACSEHYQADVELNRQVLHELYSRGYARAGEIELEECEYTCDRLMTADL